VALSAAPTPDQPAIPFAFLAMEMAVFLWAEESGSQRRAGLDFATKAFMDSQSIWHAVVYRNESRFNG
jgi:hypothetical protein